MSGTCRKCGRYITESVVEDMHEGFNSCNVSRCPIMSSSSGDFTTSLIIGALTGSALLGGLLGGDMAGGIVGDLLDGDLMD